jgi:hypothetical protein
LLQQLLQLFLLKPPPSLLELQEPCQSKPPILPPQ